jgi:hypothetical protein
MYSLTDGICELFVVKNEHVTKCHTSTYFDGTRHQILLGQSNKGLSDQWDTACVRKMKNEYKILVRKHEGKRQ